MRIGFIRVRGVYVTRVWILFFLTRSLAANCANDANGPLPLLLALVTSENCAARSNHSRNSRRHYERTVGFSSPLRILVHAGIRVHRTNGFALAGRTDSCRLGWFGAVGW